MISEKLYHMITRCFFRAFRFPASIDFPVDYDVARKISRLSKVDLFLKHTTNQTVKKASNYSYEQHDIAKKQHDIVKKQLHEIFFPELRNTKIEFPEICSYFINNPGERPSLEVIDQKSQTKEFEIFFSDVIIEPLIHLYRKTSDSPKSIIFDLPYEVDNFEILWYVFERKQILIPHQKCTVHLYPFDCLFFLNRFQETFYNQLELDNNYSKVLILTDNLPLAKWNRPRFTNFYEFSNIPWISWYSKNHLDVPTSLPWQNLANKSLFWLFVPHSNQSIEDALQVLNQVEKQLTNNGIPTSQLNIISYWGPGRSCEKYPSIMPNQKFHDKIMKGHPFLAPQKIPLNTTEILMAKTSDATVVKTVILGEYYNWWQDNNISCSSQLLIIDFTGKFSDINFPTKQNLQYINTSSQTDNLETILDQKKNLFLTVIIIGGIPSVRGRIDLLADRLSEVFFKQVIIISDKTNLKPISFTGSIKVTQLKSKTKNLLKVERKGKNITYKKYYCEIKDDQWQRLRKAGYKRQHLSKNEKENLKDEIWKYYHPFNRITIKQIALELNITESLVKRIKKESKLSKPQQRTLIKEYTSLL